VAVSIFRLRPEALRTTVVAGVVAWAVLSGSLQLTHRDKVDWRGPIRQMIVSERRAPEPIRVYSRQGVAGNTVKYYLDQAGENGLQVEYTDDFAEIQDPHFWIAFVRYAHETGPLPYESFAARGDALGPIIESEAAGHSVFLVSVNRPEGPR